MPARDIYHDCVRNALIKDGWSITHDPFRLKWGRKDLYVDLAAEQLLAAEKENRRIAVEVKSFLGSSDVADLEGALGQFLLYRSVMTRTESDRTLYLAVSEDVFKDVLDDDLGRLAMADYQVPVVVFEPVQEVILRWIP